MSKPKSCPSDSLCNRLIETFKGLAGIIARFPIGVKRVFIIRVTPSGHDPHAGNALSCLEEMLSCFLCSFLAVLHGLELFRIKEEEKLKVQPFRLITLVAQASLHKTDNEEFRMNPNTLRR